MITGAYIKTLLEQVAITSENLAPSDKSRIMFPATLNEYNDVLYSHNELIALWYNSPKEGQIRIWIGELWAGPDEYKNLIVLRVFGLVPESVIAGDVINLLVNANDETPRNLPKNVSDKRDCSDDVE